MIQWTDQREVLGRRAAPRRLERLGETPWQILHMKSMIENRLSAQTINPTLIALTIDNDIVDVLLCRFVVLVHLWVELQLL